MSMMTPVPNSAAQEGRKTSHQGMPGWGSGWGWGWGWVRVRVSQQADACVRQRRELRNVGERDGLAVVGLVG